MQGFYAFFVERHDLPLVAVAAVVCLLAAYAGTSLVRHARNASQPMRVVWTAVAAVAVSAGIWATHFIAMLAFDPGFVVTYDAGTTLLSLAVAVSVCGLGLYVAVSAETLRGAWLGGAVVGLGISTMHYTGMAAMALGGDLGWNAPLVMASILAGVLFGGAALVAGREETGGSRLAGTILLTVAICAMHFSAVAAADFSRCYAAVATAVALSSGPLAGIVALAGLTILGAVLGSVMLDNAEQKRQAHERMTASRLDDVTGKLELALTHMDQGLCLFGPDARLQLHNPQYAAMVGLDGVDLTGISFEELCRRSATANTGQSGAVLERRVREIVAQHRAMIDAPDGGEVVQAFGGGRTIRVHHSPVGDGSWVMTIDDVTERLRSEAQIAHLARHDGLTGLPNRTHFIEALDTAVARVDRHEGRLAVIYVDLEDFQALNDAHGHAAGDAVLKAVATRLEADLTDGEVVARVGGDEFMALKLLKSIDDLRGFVDAIEADFVAPIGVAGTKIRASAKFGIALYPDDALDRDKLLANAELALNRARSRYDVSSCYYEADMDEYARRRREMIADIWTALKSEQFFLNYQVQKAVVGGAVTGYEVLLRWLHPVSGFISPGDFVPLAEECGAISEIGAWVLETACREAAGWQSQARIAVNLSPVQLSNPMLPLDIAAILLRTGLPAYRLELEVTETAIVADKVRALNSLRQIKTMGISIAIDDFGTGYSSLETLRTFPFDKIKLDKSFMVDVETSTQSRAIVRAILALGSSLGVPVLAEGVETEAQLRLLAKEGCTEAQGYLLGRPQRVPDDAVTLRVANAN